MIWRVLFWVCLGLPFALLLGVYFVRNFKVGDMVAFMTASLLVAIVFGWGQILFWLAGKTFEL